MLFKSDKKHYNIDKVECYLNFDLYISNIKLIIKADVNYSIPSAASKTSRLFLRPDSIIKHSQSIGNLLFEVSYIYITKKANKT